MKTHRPKISFNATPPAQVAPSPKVRHDEVTPEVSDVDMVSEPLIEDAATLYDNGTSEMEAATPANVSALEAFDDFEPAPAPRPEVQAMRDHEFDRAEWEERLTAPVAEPAPAAQPVPLPTPKPKMQNARLAALGQMAKREPSFFERNGGMLGVAGVVGITFTLGLGVALWMLGGEDDGSTAQATFSAPMTETTFVTAAVEEGPVEIATRALTPDMTDVSDAVAPSVTKEPSGLTAAVLAGLQASAAAPKQVESSDARLAREALEILSRNKIRMLTEGVLADMYDVETYQKEGVSRVRLRTINAPLVNEYASETLLKAMAIGQVEMSKALITPEGGVDVETMMFNLIQASLRSDHSTSGVEAAFGMSRKIFAASPARTQNVNGQRVYKVQTGDSLAYIALQFYGSPNAYKRILEANRSTIQSPEQIQIGQRLIIPS